MTIKDKIINEKLQYDINRAVGSPLSSGKINEYEYPAGKEILPTQKNRLIDEAKSSNYPLGEAFKKTSKNN